MAATSGAILRTEGKVKSVGLSNVTVAHIEAARKVVPVVTVQNRYNLVDRDSEDVLQYCAANGIGFIPYRPEASGNPPGGAAEATAADTGATPPQVGLAWLLAASPVMLPIPGTSSVAHLEENCAAAMVALSPDQVKALTEAAATATAAAKS